MIKDDKSVIERHESIKQNTHINEEVSNSSKSKKFSFSNFARNKTKSNRPNVVLEEARNPIHQIIETYDDSYYSGTIDNPFGDENLKMVESGSANSAKKINQKYIGKSELEVKVKPTAFSRSLEPYGDNYFLVKEKIQDKNKLVPRLLGFSKDNVLLLDETSKILKTWPLTTVKRWTASNNLFTLDFGDYADSFYSVETTEGEQIARVLAFNVDILLRHNKAKDHFAIKTNEDSNIVEDNDSLSSKAAEDDTVVNTIPKGIDRLLSSASDATEMVKQANIIASETSQLIHYIRYQVETQPDSDIQRHLFSAGVVLADTTSRFIEAAKGRTLNPDDFVSQTALKRAAEDLRNAMNTAVIKRLMPKIIDSSDLSIQPLRGSFDEIQSNDIKQNPSYISNRIIEDKNPHNTQINDKVDNSSKNTGFSNNGRYFHEFNELELIGKGSFGEVYKVLHSFDSQYYAMKKVLFNGVSDEIKEKSLKEFKVLAKLQNNEYVVQYKSSWIENNEILFIQMELCFKTLREILIQKRNKFMRQEFKTMSLIEYYISSELFREILESVDYLHKQKPPIIHRDLKPSNILITNGLNGRFIKLADFGLAVVHKFDDQTHTEGLGSFKYCAHEVRSGRSYDTKADIFSLGVITQELFDIDINGSSTMNAINNSDLSTKYKFTIKSITEMMQPMKNMRPDCEHLLSQSNQSQWSLTYNKLKTDSQFDSIIMNSVKTHSIEESFSYYFLKTKLKK